MKKIKNEKTILVGQVSELETKSSDCVIMRVTHIEWDKDTKKNVKSTSDIQFWNSKNPDYPQFADILNKFNIKEGVNVIVKYVEKDGKLYGNDFRFFSGRIGIKGETDEDCVNVIMGRVGSVSELKTSNTRNGDKTVLDISVAESRRDKDKNETTIWHSIRFWDGDKSDYATRASKVIKVGDCIAVICGNCRENGNYLNYTGYQFDILNRPKRKTDSDNSDKNATAYEDYTDNSSISCDEDDDEDYAF